MGPWAGPRERFAGAGAAGAAGDPVTGVVPGAPAAAARPRSPGVKGATDRESARPPASCNCAAGQRASLWGSGASCQARSSHCTDALLAWQRAIRGTHIEKAHSHLLHVRPWQATLWRPLEQGTGAAPGRTRPRQASARAMLVRAAAVHVQSAARHAACDRADAAARGV